MQRESTRTHTHMHESYLLLGVFTGVDQAHGMLQLFVCATKPTQYKSGTAYYYFNDFCCNLVCIWLYHFTVAVQTNRKWHEKAAYRLWYVPQARIALASN